MTSFMLNAGMFIRPNHVPPSAWIGHIPFAGWLIETLKPSVFVELGTHQGTSYFAFCQAVCEASTNTKCFAVDTWRGDEHAGEYGDQIFTQVNQYHQANYTGFSSLMRMTFDDAAHYFDNATIDLLHIDGLHTYEAVKHDFETWLPKLSDQAIVLFHDTCVRERGFGVWKFWAEIRDQFPSFEFTHTHGLGVLATGKQAHKIIEKLFDSEKYNAIAETQVTRLFERLGHETTSQTDIRFLQNALTQGEQHIASLSVKISELERTIGEQRSQLLAREHAITQQILAHIELRQDQALAEIVHIQSYLKSMRPWYRALLERLRR